MALADLREAFEKAAALDLRFEATIIHDDASRTGFEVAIETLIAKDAYSSIDVLGTAWIEIPKDELIDAMTLYTLKHGQQLDD